MAEEDKSLSWAWEKRVGGGVDGAQSASCYPIPGVWSHSWVEAKLSVAQNRYNGFSENVLLSRAGVARSNRLNRLR